MLFTIGLEHCFVLNDMLTFNHFNYRPVHPYKVIGIGAVNEPAPG